MFTHRSSGGAKGAVLSCLCEMCATFHHELLGPPGLQQVGSYTCSSLHTRHVEERSLKLIYTQLAVYHQFRRQASAPEAHAQCRAVGSLPCSLIRRIGCRHVNLQGVRRYMDINWLLKQCQTVISESQKGVKPFTTQGFAAGAIQGLVALLPLLPVSALRLAVSFGSPSVFHSRAVYNLCGLRSSAWLFNGTPSCQYT